MNKPTRGVGGDHAQQPKDAQYDENCPKHRLFRSHKRSKFRALVPHPVLAFRFFPVA